MPESVTPNADPAHTFGLWHQDATPTIADIERAICCPAGVCIAPEACYAEDRSRSYPVQIQEAARAVARMIERDRLENPMFIEATIREEVGRMTRSFGGASTTFHYAHDHDGDACVRVAITHDAGAPRVGDLGFGALVKSCNDMSYRLVTMAHEAGEGRIVYVSHHFPAGPAS